MKMDLDTARRDELIGAPFKKFFTDPERAEAGIKLVLSEKTVTNYELTACPAFSSIFWIGTWFEGSSSARRMRRPGDA